MKTLRLNDKTIAVVRPGRVDLLQCACLPIKAAATMTIAAETSQSQSLVQGSIFADADQRRAA